MKLKHLHYLVIERLLVMKKKQTTLIDRKVTCDEKKTNIT